MVVRAIPKVTHIISAHYPSHFRDSSAIYRSADVHGTAVRFGKLSFFRPTAPVGGVYLVEQLRIVIHTCSVSYDDLCYSSGSFQPVAAVAIG